jgi:hypothetical protein
MAGALLCLAVLWTGARAEAACVYPMSTTFGLADGFAPVPTDPIPYNPAYPPFVSFLGPLNLKTFDDTTSNRHMVATLRHGLASCFPGATSLTLCFVARAHNDVPANDSVVIYNTILPSTFPVIYSSAIVPTLSPTWTIGMTSTLCIDLTSQMSVIGDMLQFRLQDDSAVDYIKMTLDN